MAHQVAERYFADHNSRADREPPGMEGGRVRILPEVGPRSRRSPRPVLRRQPWTPPSVESKLPQVIHRACFAWFQAANVSTAAYAFLTIADANLLLAHGSAEQIDATFGRWPGRFFGTMCLSEPQAGSSLADITTRAEPQPDGTYRLVRQQDVDLGRRPRAVARTSSTWCWPRFPAARRASRASRCSSCRSSWSRPTAASASATTSSLAGLNHKMGYRGTTNTVLNFGDGVSSARGRAGRRRLPGRRAAPRARLTCST